MIIEKNTEPGDPFLVIFRYDADHAAAESAVAINALDHYWQEQITRPSYTSARKVMDDLLLTGGHILRAKLVHDQGKFAMKHSSLFLEKDEDISLIEATKPTLTSLTDALYHYSSNSKTDIGGIFPGMSPVERTAQASLAGQMMRDLESEGIVISDNKSSGIEFGLGRVLTNPQ